MRITVNTLLILPVLFIFFPGSLQAQFNRYGGGLSFSTGIDQNEPDRIETGNPGLTLRGVYDIDKKLFLIPSLSVYMPKKTGPTGSSVKTYYAHIDDDPSFENKLIPSPGVSVGTGVEMIIDDRFNAYTQVRYIVGKYQQLIISIGVHYYWDGRRYQSWR
jgi:hypothetical protein